jgi:hypothetical protein
VDREPRFVVVWVTTAGMLAREPYGGISQGAADDAAACFNALRPGVPHWVEPWEPDSPAQSIPPQ